MKILRYSVCIWVVLSLFSACEPIGTGSKGNFQGTERNALLPEKIMVSSEVNFLEQSIPEWISGVDTNYVKGINEAFLNSDAACFEGSPVYTDNKAIVIDKRYIKEEMQRDSAKGVSSFYFIEDWFFDAESHRLKKRIDSWSPVFEYLRTNRETGELEQLKTLLYNIDCTRGTAERRIAKSIFYEQKVEEDMFKNPFLDPNRLANLTMSPVLDGQEQVFDFFDNTVLSKEEILESLNLTPYYVEEEDETTHEKRQVLVSPALEFSDIRAYIFEEDWYFNPESFVIRKEIKSVSPVYFGSRIDGEGQVHEYKKIVFKQKY